MITTELATATPTVPDGRVAADLPRLHTANADFVTDRLLVGGDLDSSELDLAATELAELVTVGVTHVIDARCEWSDAALVSRLAPTVSYLHHSIDDAGQRVPYRWFDVGVRVALAAIGGGGTVLTHCHMGINRGPSLGYAVLLAQGWDPIDALDRIRSARPITHMGYAEDALAWHHHTVRADPLTRAHDTARVRRWRLDHRLDIAAVIRLHRRHGHRP